MMRVLAIRVVVGLALVVAPVITVVGLSTQAGAASSTTCSGVVGTVDANHASLNGCTVATTGGSGVVGVDASHTGDLVRWSNGGTTKFKFKAVKVNAAKDPCESGQTEHHLQAKVIKSTGAAAAVSGKVSAYLCIPSSGKKGKVTLVPGTLWKF
jgi:hypothetical protein